jgi:Ca2+-binding EF-hand superfamily protein
MKMVHVEKLVTKIQAVFRSKLAMRKLEKDIQKQKEKLAKKSSAKTMSSEEAALLELKQRLARKGLTPEAFFRICDPDYARSVPVEKFKTMLAHFKLELSRGQISRLALILDEDMEGNISIDEFNSALEAYGQGGEKHVATDGSDYYVTFEHRSMFKLLTILKDRNTSYDELFRMCDVNDDKDVNIKELEAVLTGFSAEFYQKDCQAIHNFFDIDKKTLAQSRSS